jgi:hypothetical protein
LYPDRAGPIASSGGERLALLILAGPGRDLRDRSARRLAQQHAGDDGSDERKDGADAEGEIEAVG